MKAQTTFEAVVWIVRIILVLCLVVFIKGIMHMSHGLIVDSKQSEYHLLLQRLYYSPYGITYAEPYSGRVYPYIINMEKFNDKQLELLYKNCTGIAVKVKAGDHEIYNDKEAFEIMNPLTWSQKYDSITYSRKLLVDSIPQTVEATIVFRK